MSCTTIYHTLRHARSIGVAIVSCPIDDVIPPDIFCGKKIEITITRIICRLQAARSKEPFADTMAVSRSPMLLVLALFVVLSIAPGNGFLVASGRKLPFRSDAALRSTATDREQLVMDLLAAAKKIGPVGSLASEEERDMMETLAKKLIGKSDRKPARQKLEGVHTLCYSAAPGGSSGRLVGPVYGKVKQTFLDNGDTFINSVELGPLKISLLANCKVKDDTTNIVTFQQMSVQLFGQTVSEKELKGGGTWKYLFMGKVQGKDGSSKLVRVMETPSLFVIEQPLL
jgi:hypothetical protein